MDELANAVKLSPGDFSSKYGFAKPEDSDAIVVHCLKGGRAVKGAVVLDEAGFEEVDVYKGSILDWKANGGELIKG